MRDAYIDDGDITVYAGDCIEVLREMSEASVDAIITDLLIEREEEYLQIIRQRLAQLSLFADHSEE